MWRPINTAPKDGTKILAITSDGNPRVIHWDHCYKMWRSAYPEGNASFVIWCPIPEFIERDLRMQN